MSEFCCVVLGYDRLVVAYGGDCIQHIGLTTNSEYVSFQSLTLIN